MTRNAMLAMATLACLLPASRAEAPALDPASATELADGLRAVLLEAMPDPLIEDDSHWGGQRMVVDGLKWRGKGLRVHPELEKTPRNDGRWWKLKATAVRLPDTLSVEVRDVEAAGPGKTAFTAYLAFDARVEYDHQRWERGVRLYSGSAEARMRVTLAVRCEATARLERNGTPLPDAVFRLRVTEARLGYDDFQVEHVAGVGGDLAKVIGEAARDGVEWLHPSLESKLLEKADTAIVKAGDTKEVRLSAMKLLK